MLVPLIIHDLLSSSSNNNDGFLPQFSRLHTQLGPGSLTPTTYDPNPYIEADFGSVKLVKKVAIQGRAGNNEWVTTYKLSHETTTGDFVDVSGPFDDEAIVFVGNSDRDTVVTSNVEPNVETRRLRLHPLSASNANSLRWEVYGRHIEFDGNISLRFLKYGNNNIPLFAVRGVYECNFE